MAVIGLNDQGKVIGPESKTREYKRDLSGPDSLIKTVVAFANSSSVRKMMAPSLASLIRRPLSRRWKIWSPTECRLNCFQPLN